jgi:hypothetical protein
MPPKVFKGSIGGFKSSLNQHKNSSSLRLDASFIRKPKSIRLGFPKGRGGRWGIPRKVWVARNGMKGMWEKKVLMGLGDVRGEGVASWGK